MNVGRYVTYSCFLENKLAVNCSPSPVSPNQTSEIMGKEPDLSYKISFDGVTTRSHFRISKF
jgi:hypothetical protein